MNAADPITPATTPLSATDLAELIAAFNDVTSKLQSTHVRLQDEVARLNSELSRANEEIERSRRLAALGEMAAGIAHEVRNPLGSIQLYARMLRDDLADRPAERRTAEKIAASARGLDAVVSDVLAFSREFRLSNEAADASEVIDRAIEACCHDGVEGWRTVRFERSDRARPPVTLSVDESLFQQALVNVVRNAIEAMVEGAAETRVLTTDVERDAEARTDVIIVRDTGPGIPAEMMARIFNPFFTTRKTGTGLGLPIVHRILEAHGGRVVVSGIGEAGGGSRGAEVRLVVPRVAAVGRAGVSEVSTRPVGGHIRTETSR